MPQPLDISLLDVADTEIPALLGVCAGSRPLTFSDGEYLFREYEVGREIYLILKGAFNVEQSSDKARHLPATTIATHWNEVNEPCFVGEMAYFADGFRTASIRSSGTTYALELQPAHLEVILEQLPTFTRILCRQFTHRLEEANKKLTELTAEDALQVEHLNLDAGTTLIRQGDRPEKLYMLIYGSLQWQKEGREVDGSTVMEFIEPAAFFTNTEYNVSVLCATPSCIAAIDQSSKQAVVRNYPQLLIQLLKAKTDN
jgi:CRP-like cAMP-binding protein